jgi:hypothetical protein
VLARRPAVALRASLVFGWTQRLTAEVIADSDDRAVALHLPGPFDHERFCDEAFLLLSPVMYDFYGVENLHTTAQHLEFATDDEPPPFFRTGLVWSSR